MIPAYTPSSLACSFQADHPKSNPDKTNQYLAATANLTLSFDQKQDLNKILNTLLGVYGSEILSFDQLSNDVCQHILEKLYDQIDDASFFQLKEAGFVTASEGSCHSNLPATDKLNALKTFLDCAPTEALSELKAKHAARYQDNPPIEKLTSRQIRQQVKVFNSNVGGNGWENVMEPPTSERESNLYKED